MSQLRSFQISVLYNQRMNQQLLICCQQLSQTQCEQETGSFFPNVIAYWNHLLFGDLILIRRIIANKIAGLSLSLLDGLPIATSTSDCYCSTIDEVIELRTKVDIIIEQVINALSENDISKLIHYKTTEGDEVSARVSDILQHMFNHQTHHRGQLTCVLSQLGINFGCTDLPVLVSEMKDLV